jgi:hypothetical protein
VHGFPEAFGIGDEDNFDNIPHMISETRRVVAEHGMTGRMSTWPVPVSMMFTVASTEYVIKWLNGEAPDDHIDTELFTRLCEDYVMEFTGSDAKINLAVLEEHGVVYDNVLMLLMGYLVY